MKRPGHPPVEPVAPVPALGDAALSRIERGVFVALDRDAGERPLSPTLAARPRRRWPFVAVTATALAAMVVLGARELRRVAEPAGRAARIATATSPSHLTLEGAAIDVAPASAIDFVNERDGATVIRLERGSVVCAVAPRSARAPFVVEAGATRVTVIGTRFGVTRIGDHAQVWVEHGTVEVGDEGLIQLVHAGERYLPGEAATSPGTVSANVAAPANPTPIGGGPQAGTTAVAAGETAAPERPQPQPHPDPTRARLALRASDVGKPARGARAEPSLGAPPVAPAVPAPTPAAAAVPAPSPAPAAPAPGIALRQRFEFGAGLEVRDPAAALRVYQELATGSGPWAANALFAQGRLSAERGQRDAAQVLLADYLRRFPDGPNAEDARALLTRLKGGGDGPAR